jgi:hypothetical protein
MLNLKEVSERCERATKGPWDGYYGKNHVSISSPVENCRIYISQRDSICLPETFKRQKSDANFIAHSRTDLPEAIRLLRSSAEIIRDLLDLLVADTGDPRQPARVKIANEWLMEVSDETE